MTYRCKAENCKCKISLTQQITNKCKCGLLFCNKHKMPEQHKCSYDWSVKSETFISENKCVVKKVTDI